jgi:hypothetical protein
MRWKVGEEGVRQEGRWRRRKEGRATGGRERRGMR